MANVTKPPILDGTGQVIKQKLSEILAALQSSGGSYIPTSQKGAASGVAELDANGKVPSAQLPTYPTVNNSTITIKKNGTDVGSFTLNQSSAENIDISVPTKTSDLTNDSGFITSYTDEKITAEEKNPTSEKVYNIPFTDSTTNQKPFINDGIKFRTLQGTSGSSGMAYLMLGNDIASGTAGNKYGNLRIYSRSQYFMNVIPVNNLTANRSFTLPDKSGTAATTDDIPTITDTYDGTSSDGMSGKAVKSAIDALDVTTSGAGASKTLTALSQTDGKISATFGNISITKSQVSDFPTIPTITDTYSGTSSDGMSGKAVKSAIDALDGTITGSAGAGKTLTAFSQTDGKVSATFADISITKSQISDFPTIPTVYNSTITIKKNGTTVDSFTLNQSSAKNIDISVPTKTSDLTNDSGFITSYTDEKVTGETTNPSSNTEYYVTWVSGTANQKPKINNGIKVITREGTTSAGGLGLIRLGNATATGTAGNKYGVLRIYAEKSGYVNLKATAASTNERNIYLPDKAGTIALTTDTMTPASHTHGNIQNGGTLQTTDVAIASGDKLVICDSSDSNKIARSSLAFTSNTSKFLREDGTWQTVTATWNGGTVANASTFSNTVTFNDDIYTDDIIPTGNNISSLGSQYKRFLYAWIQTRLNIGAGGNIGEINFNSDIGVKTLLRANSTSPSSDITVYMPSTGGTLLTDTKTTGTITKAGNAASTGTLDKTYCVKRGGIAYVAGRVHTMASTTVANGTFFSIPTGFRPAETTQVMGGIRLVSPDTFYPMLVEITTGGNVNFYYSASSKTTQVYFCGCYPVA